MESYPTEYCGYLPIDTSSAKSKGESNWLELLGNLRTFVKFEASPLIPTTKRINPKLMHTRKPKSASEAFLFGCALSTPLAHTHTKLRKQQTNQPQNNNTDRPPSNLLTRTSSCIPHSYSIPDPLTLLEGYILKKKNSPSYMQ